MADYYGVRKASPLTSRKRQFFDIIYALEFPASGQVWTLADTTFLLRPLPFPHFLTGFSQEHSLIRIGVPKSLSQALLLGNLIQDHMG